MTPSSIQEPAEKQREELTQLYCRTSFVSLLNPAQIVASLWAQRTLIRHFAARAIKAQYRGSTLGVLWNVLQPVLLFSVYAFVFGIIFDSRFGAEASETKVEYAIGLFLSLSLAQLVLDTLTIAPGLVLQTPNFVKKVVFPLEVLPLASLGPLFMRAAISLGLALIATAIWGRGFAWTVGWLPVVLLAFLLLAAGIAWGLAAVGVFIRDVAPLMQFVSTMLMFTSGIFYSLHQIPAAFSFLKFNPLLIGVEAARAAVLWNQSVPIGNIIYLMAAGLLVFIGGYAVFQTTKPAFSDVL